MLSVGRKIGSSAQPCGRMHILCALELRRGDDETATTMHNTLPFSPTPRKRALRPALPPIMWRGSINSLRAALRVRVRVRAPFLANHHDETPLTTVL